LPSVEPLMFWSIREEIFFINLSEQFMKQPSAS
jgi:hypothetical protein